MKNFLLLLFYILSSFASAQSQERLPCIDKKFLLVVHIVKDNNGNQNITTTTIEDNIKLLNIQFAPICVSFDVTCIEYKDINNSYYDTVKNKNWEEMQTLYNVNNRINIYYVNDILNPPSIGGFADTSGITNFTAKGIVLKKSSTPRTLYHEMGHYFGLKHTFETANGIELANGSNCATAGDQICDTPADPFVEGAPASDYVDINCKFIFMGKDSNGQYYDPITGNNMSYYPSACTCGFTHDQYMKMAKTYLAKKGMW